MTAKVSRALCVGIMVVTAITTAACAGTASNRGSDPTATIEIYSDKDPAHENLLRQQVADFEGLHPTIKVSIMHFATAELSVEFKNAALAHGGPELVYAPDDDIVPWARSRIIQPVDTVMGASFMKQFADNAVGAVSYRGHAYAAPDISGGQLLLMYNRKIATDSAMSQFTGFIWPPDNANDLLKAVKGFNDPSKNQYGLVFNEIDPLWLVPWVGGFGGALIDTNGKPTLNTPSVIDALAYEYSLRTGAGLSPAVDNASADRIFRAGRAAFMINGDWSIRSYQDTFGADFGMTRLPVVNKTGKWASPYMTARGYSINAYTKGEKLMAVGLFLRYISQPGHNVEVAALGDVPANKVAAADRRVKDHPILGILSGALARGTPMPIEPEMAAVWDAMKGPLADVMNGTEDPPSAALAMQKNAEQRISQLGS